MKSRSECFGINYYSLGNIFFNQQVIILLENMGVPYHLFLRFQNRARFKISMSLLTDEAAAHTLGQTIRLFDWDRMHHSGVALTREPFARRLLLLLAQEK